jgi:hypothetical protein
MKAAAPEWEVDGFESFVGHFSGVDVKDQHVAAATQKLSLEEHPGQPVALVTENVKDFKQQAFAGTAVTGYSVANYLAALARESPDRVAASCETMRRRLKHPAQTLSQFVERFREVQGCKGFAKQLEAEWVLKPKAAAVRARLLIRRQMFEHKRLCGDGAYVARAEQLCAGDQHVDGQDDEIAHRANGTIAATGAKTAQRERIAARYEFRPHRARPSTI